MDDIERLSIRGPRFGALAELQLGLRQQVREVIRVRIDRQRRAIGVGGSAHIAFDAPQVLPIQCRGVG